VGDFSKTFRKNFEHCKRTTFPERVAMTTYQNDRPQKPKNSQIYRLIAPDRTPNDRRSGCDICPASNAGASSSRKKAFLFHR